MEPHDLAALARRDAEAARRELDALPLPARAELLTGLPAREQWSLIFVSTDPTELVRALPKPNFFWLFHEIGVGDAGELVPLASPAQIEFCLDMECWRRGRLEHARFDEWLARLVEAGPRPLFRTLANLDFELLVAFFGERMRVEKRDPDTDPLEQDDPALRTLDDFHQFAFENIDEETEEVLVRVLKVIRDRSPDLFLQLLEAIRQDLPSRVEEEARRFRDGRLADEGLPDYDSALDLFAQVDYQRFDLEKHRKQSLDGPLAAPGGVGGNELVLVDQPAEGFLGKALAAVTPAMRGTIERELVQLLNRAIVATVEDLGDLTAVRRAGHMVQRHLTIGLEELSGAQVSRAAELLERARLQSIFQAGWTRVAELRRRAARLAERPWFQPFGGTTSVLGYLADQSLTALRGEQIAYHRGLDRDGEVGTRPFEELSDVHRAEAVLNRAEAIALFLFERAGLAPEAWPDLDLTDCTVSDFRDLAAHQILATVIANALLDGRPRFEAIPEGELGALRDRLIGAEATAPASPAHPSHEQALAALDAWMTPRVADLPIAVTAVIQRYVDECVEALTRELGPFRAGARIEPLALPTLVVRIS